jgi:flavin reductase
MPISNRLVLRRECSHGFQKDYAARFSNSACRKRCFQQGDWRVLTTGTPVLAGGLVSFDCKVRQSFEYQSHTIFIGEIMDLEL